MRQCGKCKRLIIGSCRYCGADEVVNLDLSVPRDEELGSYKISALETRVGNRVYRVVEAVGIGAHGIVLKVEGGTNENYERYALKVPLEFNEYFSNSQGNRKSLLTLSRKYVAHEVEMLKKIKGPGLLNVLYAGLVICEGGAVRVELPGVLMELALGTLKDLLDMQVNGLIEIPFSERVVIIDQLTGDICQLHETGMIHRDLSPHNVFIVEREGEIRYVLGDMGTSKPVNIYDIDNSTTRMAFHDRYLDPALLKYDGFRYDRRLDIYQLGVIIAETWMGEYWLGDEEDASGFSFNSGLDFSSGFLGKLTTGEIPRPLSVVLAKATGLEINERYRSAEEFRHEVLLALAKCDQTGTMHTGRGEIEPGFKKNICLSYRRVLGGANGDIPRTIAANSIHLTYQGQKRIEIGNADEVFIDWTPGMEIKRVSVAGESFLGCRVKENGLVIKINSEDILEVVRLPGKKGGDDLYSWHLEFEARSFLTIEGMPMEIAPQVLPTGNGQTHPAVVQKCLAGRQKSRTGEKVLAGQPGNFHALHREKKQHMVEQVFTTLAEKGMVRAFLEWDGEEFIYPGYVDAVGYAGEKRQGLRLWIWGAVLTLVVVVMVLSWLALSRGTGNEVNSEQNLPDRFGMTRLHHAVIGGEKEMAERLCREGEDVNGPDRYGWTPLHWAVFKNDWKLCQVLLQYGAQPGIKTSHAWFKYKSGLSALQMAGLLKQKELFNLLASYLKQDKEYQEKKNKKRK